MSPKKELKVIISTLNSQYIHSSLAPWCLLAGVNRYCDASVLAEVAEGTINESLTAVAVRIVAGMPSVIGFSCYIWNITETRALIKLVKQELPEAIIILGGPEVSYNPREVLAGNPLVDFVLCGEGERSFPQLLNAIAVDGAYEGIQGLCRRQWEDGEVDSHCESAVLTEDPPSPYSPQYFAALKGRIAYLETSRGCPYACAFCLSGEWGNRGGVRFFDLEAAKKNLLALAVSGAKTIKLVDRTFNANGKRAIELLRFIIDNYGRAIPKGICFHFEIAGDILQEEILTLLGTAPVGAIQFEIGLQSFNPQTLESIHRRTVIPRLVENIRRILAGGNIHTHIDLIAGLPFEGIAQMSHSFNMAYELRPHMLQLGFLKLLHGSAMRENGGEYPCEYAPCPPYEVRSTPWLSEGELHRLHGLEDALNRLYNSGRFSRTLEYLLKSGGFTPFELFDSFGTWVGEQGCNRPSLEEYTDLAFHFFSAQGGVDSKRLRDVMLWDRLAVNSSGVIPLSLRISDPMLKQVRFKLDRHPETCRPPQIKRSIGILYTEGIAVYADYEQRNPITGEYPLRTLRLSELTT